jgi:hypothetical protein
MVEKKGIGEESLVVVADSHEVSLNRNYQFLYTH